MSEHKTISESNPVGYDPLYVETHYAKYFETELTYKFYLYIKTHMAWATMLAEQEIIPRQSAAQICQALQALQKEEPDVLRPYVPAHADVYVHMEKYLVKQIGEEHVGHLALARTRPEPIGRMAIRERLLKVMDASLTMQENILDTAERNVETVMPGYTHAVPAQPTTFAHYLMGAYDFFEEDARRMEEAFDTVNRCSLGCGALAGTSFPIDRYRTADLLGFDGICESTYASVATNDYPIVSANSIVNTLVTISRMVQDFNEWCSYEVRMTLTAPQFSGVSSLMPQKYNPTVLELTRLRAARGVLSAQSVASMLMKCDYGDVREYDGIWAPTLDVLDDAADTLRLFGATIDTMIIYEDRMLELARGGFQTVSELADEIYRQTGLPYRTAHGIVANVVNQALDAGLEAMDITTEMVDGAAEKVIGKPLRMSQEDITRSLDPVNFVESHDVVGGPAPKEVRRVIGVRRERLAEARERQAQRKARLEKGDELLAKAVQEMIASAA